MASYVTLIWRFAGACLTYIFFFIYIMEDS